MGSESFWAWRAASEPDEPDDDDRDAPQAPQAPEPPQELWGLGDGDQLHGAGEGDVMAWESRDDAAGHACETGRPVLLGVHPAWRRRALAAEAVRDRYQAALARIAAVYAIHPDDLDVTYGHEAMTIARAALAAEPAQESVFEVHDHGRSLVCPGCGHREPVSLPMDAGEYGRLLRAFAAAHARCLNEPAG